MYVLLPITVTDSVLTASSLTETDHSAWASATTYAEGDRVIVVSSTLAKFTSEAWTEGQPIYWNNARSKATTTVTANALIGFAASAAAAGTSTGSVAVHSIYESVAASNTGNNPVSDDGTKWVKVGATNKWQPFDRKVSDQATGSSPITWTFTLPSLVTGLALFGLEASSVTVTVTDTSAATVFTETRDTAGGEEIVDWWTYFAWDGSADRETIFTELPGYTGYTIEVSVAGTSPSVGQIVLGRVVSLGTAMLGTEVGFEDYSRKDRDDFGNPVLIERDYSDLATFQFSIPLADLRRVKRIIAELRASPAVWFAGTGDISAAALIFGFPSGGFRVPLSIAGAHIASLEIEGLT